MTVKRVFCGDLIYDQDSTRLDVRYGRVDAIITIITIIIQRREENSSKYVYDNAKSCLLVRYDSTVVPW